MEEMVLRFEERWCFEAGVSLQVILLLQELLQLRKKKTPRLITSRHPSTPILRLCSQSVHLLSPSVSFPPF